MLRKYGDPVVAGYTMPYSPSPLWRSIVSVYPRVSLHCQWIIGRGLIPTWGTNWSGSIINNPGGFSYNPNIRQIKLSPIICNSAGTSINIRNVLLPEVVSVLNDVVLNDEADRLCWVLTQHGEFTTKSYWEQHRIRYAKHNWSKFYWNKFILPWIGVFLWKLSRNAIPVDARLLSMGFKLASRCVCCNNPDTETVDHLFILGETAREVWIHFANLFNFTSYPTNMNQLAEVWLHQISLDNPLDISRNIIFAYCLWEIWKLRNSIILDKGAKNSRMIISRVTASLQLASRAHNLELDMGARPISAGANPYLPTVGGGHSIWMAPLEGLKLNIAALSGDGRVTVAGGIVRNMDG